MFTGKQFNKKRVGQVLDARTINQILDRLARLERLGATDPIDIDQAPGGATISWNGPVTDVQMFVPTNGPIPAATGTIAGGNLTAGTAQAMRYYRDPATSALAAYITPPEDIYNWASFAVGDVNSIILCALVNDDWFVLNDACPTGGG